MTRNAAITYDGLPISSGGAHKLRTRGVVEGFDALQSFVSEVSTTPTPVNLTLEVVKEIKYPSVFANQLISSFNSQYKAKPWTRGIGDFVGHQWELEATSLNEAIQQLETERPIPTAGYAGSAAVLHATWNLSLMDRSTRQELPHQNKEDYLGFCVELQQYLGISSLYARISEKTSANLFLCLPFEQVDNNACELASEIQKHFPARMSSKHWKKWSLTKKGNSYVGRKIEGLI